MRSRQNRNSDWRAFRSARSQSLSVSSRGGAAQAGRVQLARSRSRRPTLYERFIGLYALEPIAEPAQYPVLSHLLYKSLARAAKTWLWSRFRRDQKKQKLSFKTTRPVSPTIDSHTQL